MFSNIEMRREWLGGGVEIVKEKAYFPDPGGAPHTPRRSSTEEFLVRVTTDWASEVRHALNAQLSDLDPILAQSFSRRMLTEPFRNVWFEMFVGWFLTRAGGVIEHDPVGENGSVPDWRATFPDGLMYVEATSPDYNDDWTRQRREYDRLVGVLDDLTPHGWSYIVKRLPRYGPNDSIRSFRMTVADLFASLPAAGQASATFADPLLIQGTTEKGLVALAMVATRYDWE